jgi:DNA-binding phage protein
LPNGKGIRYSTGQPMGAKSSFPMLALTHHIIVQQAALRAGVPNFSNYVILGDDIVINSTPVAESYMKIMKELGLELSINKSIISTSDTSHTRTAEICRRLFSNGQDYSPLPTKLIATVIEYGDMAYQLQEDLYKRDLVTSHSSLLVFLSGILNETNISLIATLNGLPSEVTGMKYSTPFSEFPQFNHNNYEKMYGITASNLVEFYTYCILVEQLKRADSILKNTTDTYSTITKAASISKTVGIGSPETGYMPVESFTSDEMDDWDIVETFHPAVEAVRADIDRINMILMQLVSATADVKSLLRGKLVDSLKISSYENMPDTDFAQAKVTRKLVDTTLRLIKAAKNTKHQEQTYTVKLTRLNIL